MTSWDRIQRNPWDAEEVPNLSVVPGADRERDRDTLQLLT